MTMWRVLVVDDDEDAADLLAFALPRHGFSVTVAHSLAEAHTLLGNEFDALVSDVNLPDGTGFDVLSGAARRPAVAVIASGSDGPEDRQRAREVGFAAHLVKPIDIDKLAATLHRLLA
jgi:CheY-like chemotaxis protein